MTPEENRNSSPAGGPGPSAADRSERGPRRRRRRGSRGRGRNRQMPAPEAAPEAVPQAGHEPAPEAMPQAVHEPAPEPASPPCDVVQVVQEARDIASDSAVHERPELYAHRLPVLGAELVHWRPRGEREFRYLLRESFD